MVFKFNITSTNPLYKCEGSDRGSPVYVWAKQTPDASGVCLDQRVRVLHCVSLSQLSRGKFTNID